MTDASQPRISTRINTLNDAIIELGRDRDRAEYFAQQAGDLQHDQTSRHDAATGLCAAGAALFSMKGIGDTTFGKVMKFGFLAVGATLLATRKSKRGDLTELREQALQNAQLLDLLMYEKTSHDPGHYGENGLHKYADTPRKWQRLQRDAAYRNRLLSK